MLNFVEHHWIQLLWSAGIIAGAIIVGMLVRWLLFWVLGRITRSHGGLLLGSLVRHSRGPAHWIFPLLAILVVSPAVPLPRIAQVALQHIVGLGLIAATAWLIILLIEVATDVLVGRHRADIADSLAARRIETQFEMLHRIAIVLVILVTIAVMLMTFPAIKHIGESLLASAGLASLVVGLAMKGTLSNLVAGVQIAFTQPFRLEDAVVIEGEWGWIEEIGTMYVVVRIWDLRRLVLPLSYFLDHPFQNWTRTSADLLAHCFIYVDYSMPVEPLRQELGRILASTPLWNKKVNVLQVSDFQQNVMQLRALMDARNSGDAWDLRCYVREKLIAFVQQNYPQCLPKYRGEMQNLEALAPRNQNGQAGPLPRHLTRSA